MIDHETRTVSVRGDKLRINVLEGGNGEPLVYLHGAGGLAGWTPYLDRLAQDFKVFAPYHPGVGDSSGIEYLDDLWDLVLFYEELLDSLGLQRTFLVGHSYGGMLAAELAAHCRSRIRGLVLIGALGLWLDETPVADFFVLSPEENAKLAWYDPDSPVARASVVTPVKPEDALEAYVDRVRTLAAIGKFVWPIPERGLERRLHRITAPALLVWGKADGIVPPVYGEEFNRLISGSHLMVMEKCGHRPQDESPEEFCSAIVQFLRNVR